MTVAARPAGSRRGSVDRDVWRCRGQEWRCSDGEDGRSDGRRLPPGCATGGERSGTSVAPLGTTRSGRGVGVGTGSGRSRGCGCGLAAAGAGGAGRRGGAGVRVRQSPRHSRAGGIGGAVRPPDRAPRADPPGRIPRRGSGRAVRRDDAAATDRRQAPAAQPPGAVVVRGLPRLRCAQRARPPRACCDFPHRDVRHRQRPAVRVGGRPARLDGAPPGSRRARRYGAHRSLPRRGGSEHRDPRGVAGGDGQRCQCRGVPVLPAVTHRPLQPSDRLRPVHGAVLPRGGGVAGDRQEGTAHLRAAARHGALRAGDGSPHRRRQHRGRVAVAAA